MNYVLVETILRKALKEIDDAPERRLRNLVDLCVNFSRGRFHRKLMSAAQRMLQDPRSAYYALLKDLVATVNHDTIAIFGANVGYNSCTYGARIIREIEARQGFNIPWSLSLIIDGQAYERLARNYQSVVAQGRALGIYTYFLFVKGNPLNVLELAAQNPDCAFIVICGSGEITPSLLACAHPLNNLAFGVEDCGGMTDACGALREGGFLYAILVRYDQTAAERILRGDLVQDMEAMRIPFALTVPTQDCPAETQQAIYAYINEVRQGQRHPLLCLDMRSDNMLVDSIISDDCVALGFCEDGAMFTAGGRITSEDRNIFSNPLEDILQSAFPKQAPLHLER